MCVVSARAVLQRKAPHSKQLALALWCFCWLMSSAFVGYCSLKASVVLPSLRVPGTSAASNEARRGGRRSAARNIMLLGDRGCREPQVLGEEEFQVCAHKRTCTFLDTYIHMCTRAATGMHIYWVGFLKNFSCQTTNLALLACISPQKGKTRLRV